jgi:hypothetical protein
VLSGLARNVGLAAAFAKHGEDAWYLLLDDDTWIEWEVIEKTLAACVGHPTFGLVMPTNGANGCFVDKKLRNNPEFSWLDYNVPHRVVFLSGKVVAAIGFHDARFGWREDVEYAIRAKCAGFRAIAMHVGNAKYHSNKEFAASGGYAATGAEQHAKRVIAMVAGAEQICDVFPWAKQNKCGTLLWVRQFEALSEAERASYATYHGEYRIERV